MPNRIALRPHGRIRQARQKAGLSQSALAEKLSVHRSAVSQWEAPAGSLPTLENLIAVARLTVVNFEWLASGRGSMSCQPGEHDAPLLHASWAHDFQEERLLKEFRMMPVAGRKALIDFLDAMKRAK